MPPSIDVDWISDLDNKVEAFSERFPSLHNVKISLIKLSFLMNSKLLLFSKVLSGIEIEPFIK